MSMELQKALSLPSGAEKMTLVDALAIAVATVKHGPRLFMDEARRQQMDEAAEILDKHARSVIRSQVTAKVKAERRRKNKAEAMRFREKCS